MDIEPGCMPQSVNFGHEVLIRERRPYVALCFLTWRQLDRRWCQVLIGDQAQQVLDTIQARVLLHIRVYDTPRRLLDIGVGKHGVFGFGVFHPALARLQIHGA